MCRWDNKLPGSYGHCAMCLTNTLLLYISYLHQFWLGTRFPNISGRLWIQCFWIFILGTTNHVIKVVMLSLVSTVHQLIAYKMICVLFQIKTGLLGLEGCKVNNWRNTFYFLFSFFSAAHVSLLHVFVVFLFCASPRVFLPKATLFFVVWDTFLGAAQCNEVHHRFNRELFLYLTKLIDPFLDGTSI